MDSLTKKEFMDNRYAAEITQYLLGSPEDQLYLQEIEHYLQASEEPGNIYEGLNYLEEKRIVEREIIENDEITVGAVYKITEDGRNFLEQIGYLNAEEVFEKQHMELDRSNYYGPRH